MFQNFNEAHRTNLLPESIKRDFRRAYYFKLASFVCIFLGVGASIGGGLLVPSYLLARSEAESGTRYVRALEETLGLREEGGASGAIAILAERVKLLEEYIHPPRTADVVVLLERALPDEVILKAIKVRFFDTTTGDVSISGIAESRVDLLAFSDALKTTPEFTNVVVPVGQLARETNLEFSFSFGFQISTP